MKGSCVELETLFPSYLAGDIDGPERERFEQHLRVCQECSRRAAEHRRLARALEECALPGMPEGLTERIRAAMPQAPDPLNPVLARRLRILRGLDIGTLVVAGISLIAFLVPKFSAWALAALDSLGLGHEVITGLESFILELEAHHWAFLIVFVLATALFVLEHFFLQRHLVGVTERN